MAAQRRPSKDLDESDVHVRPGRGSRPRTRKRPKHENAREGFVLAVDRGRYRLLLDGNQIVAMRARELGRRSVVVGDRVNVVGDTSGRPGSLARIVRIQPRTSTLRRTADDEDAVERVIVANADQMVIVCALADPPPRPRLIDRCLVAAYDAGIDPLLCLTKADLADPDELMAAYEPLGVPAVSTQRGGSLDALCDWLRGRLSVFVGHSGVGKSTLVNALVPDAGRATGSVNAATGRGRHVSSSAVALALPHDDGWLVDTPGVRSFGLAHVDPQTVVAAFPDLAPGTDECPRGCDHHADEHCALDAWVASGHADPARLDSLRRLLASRDRASGD
ncbi:MAG: ribosome small subunit-dependent GTPase A [Streptosporangiales bacterium]